MKKLLLSLQITLITSCLASAELIGGVEFPQGARSFADAVLAYAPGEGVQSPYNHTANALGVPEGNLQSALSLGQGGFVVVAFTDNLLTGSGDSSVDLWIFEVGGQAEHTFVEISQDGVEWVSVGEVGGYTSGIDIDAYGFTQFDQFSHVRITDNPDEGGNSGPYVGADIDAVGAISSELIDIDIPVESKIFTSVEVVWATEPGKLYRVERADSINASEWITVYGPIPGSGDTLSYFHTTRNTTRSFFRVFCNE